LGPEVAAKKAVGLFHPEAGLGQHRYFFLLPGLFLAFDIAYSSLTSGEEKERSARIANPVYDHGFAANFEGHGVWGDLRYPLATNNLGLKDASVRDVPLKPDSRRILLIGDSFTEAIGMSFEDSFAGQLYRAGQQRSEKIEFLNAGVASYSPSIYYKKIKYLLERGLQFDEVVVFSDSSDVNDEAKTISASTTIQNTALIAPRRRVPCKRQPQGRVGEIFSSIVS